MISKKLLALLGLTTVSVSMLVGCNIDKKISDSDDVENTIDFKEDTIENILLNYNAEGMKILKANYPEQEKMETALRNIGNTLSNIKLNDLNGKSVNLDQFKGKKVLIEVMQEDCKYCKENTPIIHKNFENREDIVLVSIFLNSTVEGVKDYYKSLNLEVPTNVWLDDNKDVVSEFNLTQTPTNIFVDESGKISLIKEDVYDNNTLNDDIKLAFESDKIYDMTVNK